MLVLAGKSLRRLTVTRIEFRFFGLMMISLTFPTSTPWYFTGDP